MDEFLQAANCGDGSSILTQIDHEISRGEHLLKRWGFALAWTCFARAEQWRQELLGTETASQASKDAAKGLAPRLRYLAALSRHGLEDHQFAVTHFRTRPEDLSPKSKLLLGVSMGNLASSHDPAALAQIAGLLSVILASPEEITATQFRLEEAILAQGCHMLSALYRLGEGGLTQDLSSARAALRIGLQGVRAPELRAFLEAAFLKCKEPPFGND